MGEQMKSSETPMGRRGALRVIAAAALAAGGCGSTAEYGKSLVNTGVTKMMKRVRQNNSDRSGMSARRKDNPLCKEDATRIAKYADELPAVNVKIHYAKPYEHGRHLAPLEPERLNLRVANRLPAVTQLKNLEDALPEKASRPRLVMGNPDSDLPTKLAKDYQLSRRSGVFGIEHYGKGEFAIDIKRKTGITGGLFGRDTSTYRVRITYGEAAFRAEQKLDDDLSIAELGENLLVAWGAVPITEKYIVPFETAIQKGFDHLFAYILTNDNPPDGMSYIDQVVSRGREGKENNTISVLRNAKETGAKNIIVFDYKVGSSVLYLGDNVKDIFATDNSIEFTTEETGISHLASFLYRLGSVATRYPREKKVDDKRYYYSTAAPTSGGGETGGPGGIGWGGGEPGEGPGGGIE